jgi:uncharacterized protein Veg
MLPVRLLTDIMEKAYDIVFQHVIFRDKIQCHKYVSYSWKDIMHDSYDILYT